MRQATSPERYELVDGLVFCYWEGVFTDKAR
ncbi:hypothetical protein BN9982_2710002 [Mycobacterium tuberculosis]|nr:hypothetical protein BN9982_2710002 [Mycobacterium tuberculosis]